MDDVTDRSPVRLSFSPYHTYVFHTCVLSHRDGNPKTGVRLLTGHLFFMCNNAAGAAGSSFFGSDPLAGVLSAVVNFEL